MSTTLTWLVVYDIKSPNLKKFNSTKRRFYYYFHKYFKNEKPMFVSKSTLFLDDEGLRKIKKIFEKFTYDEIFFAVAKITELKLME